MPGEEDGERPIKASTWLVIPYFSDDFGRPTLERPIDPNRATTWICPSIIIDGLPGNTSFVRGVPTSVTVDVANWGAGSITAPVQLRIWWADPTTSFTTATLFGQTVLLAPPGGVPVRSRPIVGTIPVTAPAHVCLLVHVAAPMDSSPAGSVPDPDGDRHWAQLNLLEVVADVEGTFQFSTRLGNPFDREAVGTVRLEQLAEGQVGAVGSRLGRDLGTTDPEDVQLLVDGEFTEGEVRLAPHESRLLEVSGRIAGLAAGHPMVIVVTQSITADGGDSALRGELGVLVTPPDR